MLCQIRGLGSIGAWIVPKYNNHSRDDQIPESPKVGLKARLISELVMQSMILSQNQPVLRRYVVLEYENGFASELFN